MSDHTITTKDRLLIPRGYKAVWHCRICKKLFLIPKSDREENEEEFKCDDCALGVQRGAFR